MSKEGAELLNDASADESHGDISSAVGQRGDEPAELSEAALDGRERTEATGAGDSEGVERVSERERRVEWSVRERRFSLFCY